MTLILGIDPGSRVTGYGVIRTTGARQDYVDSGCIRTHEKAPLPEKLAEIYAGLETLIATHRPDEMAIEKVFMARSADAALKLGQARGAAIVACANQAVPVFEYEARKVKQAVVGTGGANKSQVQHMVQQLLGLSGAPQSDASDALAIALCHCQTRLSLGRMSADGATFSRGRLRTTR